MTEIQNQILHFASLKLGIVEKPNNTGWVNEPAYEAEMRVLGWYSGGSWCCFDAEWVWIKSYKNINPSVIPLLSKYFSGNAQETARNFHKSKEFTTSTTVPVLGAVAIWQHGSGTSGHAGIVVAIEKTGFWTTEGNTSAAGSREGTTKKKRFHKFNEPRAEKKLNLTRFIYPL